MSAWWQNLSTADMYHVAPMIAACLDTHPQMMAVIPPGALRRPHIRDASPSTQKKTTQRDDERPSTCVRSSNPLSLFIMKQWPPDA